MQQLAPRRNPELSNRLKILIVIFPRLREPRPHVSAERNVSWGRAAQRDAIEDGYSTRSEKGSARDLEHVPEREGPLAQPDRLLALGIVWQKRLRKPAETLEVRHCLRDGKAEEARQKCSVRQELVVPGRLSATPL